MTDETKSPRDIAAAAINDLGLSIDSEFIPFTQSRKAGQKYSSLNWLVTLKRDGADILSTHYGAGLAHCPAYSDPTLGRQDSVERFKAIQRQCETGWGGKPGRPGVHIKPDPVDVIYSLVTDSEAMSYGYFESWADAYGYDSDSRKAESIYRACLDNALKLHATLGAPTMDLLREAFQDY